jgi:hypothetical protein
VIPLVDLYGSYPSLYPPYSDDDDDDVYLDKLKTRGVKRNLSSICET